MSAALLRFWWGRRRVTRRVTARSRSSCSIRTFHNRAVFCGTAHHQATARARWHRWQLRLRAAQAPDGLHARQRLPPGSETLPSGRRRPEARSLRCTRRGASFAGPPPPPCPGDRHLRRSRRLHLRLHRRSVRLRVLRWRRYWLLESPRIEAVQAAWRAARAGGLLDRSVAAAGRVARRPSAAAVLVVSRRRPPPPPPRCRPLPDVHECARLIDPEVLRLEVVADDPLSRSLLTSSLHRARPRSSSRCGARSRRTAAAASRCAAA